jgi:predicted cupin superfamily sugar epimerase
MLSAQDIIDKLGLKAHPEEGGFYRETYLSTEIIPVEVLPDRYSSGRAFGTAIYYLLTPETYSRMHRLQSDEIFHFYLGDPVIMLLLHPDGTSREITLGSDISSGQQLQVVIPRNTWQGSCLTSGGGFALMGTTVAPGFDFTDFEAGQKDDLIAQYPQKKGLIIRLTQDGR